MINLQHMPRKRLSLTVMLIALMACAVVASTLSTDPFAFFQPSLTVTAERRSALDQGRPVARVIASKDAEVGVWAAVPVHVDGDRLVAWMRRIDELKKSKYVLAIGRFSSPPRLENLAALSLDHEDASELAACHPGDCALKLSAAEMTTLQHLAEQPDTLDRTFRQLLLDRVNAYLGGGRIGPYADTTRRSLAWPGVRPPARRLAIHQHARAIARRLIAHRRSSVDATRRIVSLLVEGKPWRQADRQCHRCPYRPRRWCERA